LCKCGATSAAKIKALVARIHELEEELEAGRAAAQQLRRDKVNLTIVLEQEQEAMFHNFTRQINQLNAEKRTLEERIKQLVSEKNEAQPLAGDPVLSHDIAAGMEVRKLREEWQDQNKVIEFLRQTISKQQQHLDEVEAKYQLELLGLREKFEEASEASRQARDAIQAALDQSVKSWRTYFVEEYAREKKAAEAMTELIRRLEKPNHMAPSSGAAAEPASNNAHSVTSDGGFDTDEESVDEFVAHSANEISVGFGSLYLYPKTDDSTQQSVPMDSEQSFFAAFSPTDSPEVSGTE
uniref:GOLGA2L5 domain-containing protein n=1 Tax=Gongylonema pulchrum TaxID=637853 RepID=A0A183EJ84_9BILA